MTEIRAAPTDPRYDSFAEAGFRGRVTILFRAFLSFWALVGFLLLPTMKLRAAYALAIARLPLFKSFGFFRAMFSIIDEAEQKGATR